MKAMKTITVMETVVLALIVFTISFFASTIYHFKDFL